MILKVICKRYKTYLKDTLPIINYYKDQSLLHEIDGINKIASINGEISTIINSLET